MIFFLIVLDKKMADKVESSALQKWLAYSIAMVQRWGIVLTQFVAWLAVLFYIAVFSIPEFHDMVRTSTFSFLINDTLEFKDASPFFVPGIDDDEKARYKGIFSLNRIICLSILAISMLNLIGFSFWSTMYSLDSTQTAYNRGLILENFPSVPPAIIRTGFFSSMFFFNDKPSCNNTEGGGQGEYDCWLESWTAYTEHLKILMITVVLAVMSCIIIWTASAISGDGGQRMATALLDEENYEKYKLILFSLIFFALILGNFGRVVDFNQNIEFILKLFSSLLLCLAAFFVMLYDYALYSTDHGTNFSANFLGMDVNKNDGIFLNLILIVALIASAMTLF